MEHAQANQKIGSRRKIAGHSLPQRGGRKQGIAQRRDDSRHGDDQSCAQTHPHQRTNSRNRWSAPGPRPPRRQRDRRHQQQSVHHVRRKVNRAPHRHIACHVLKQHQPGAQQGFGEHQHQRCGRGLAHPVAARERLPRPPHQNHHANQRHPAHHAVGEFNEGLDARRLRNHFTVTGWPVRSAPGSRTRSPHQCAPYNHQ